MRGRKVRKQKRSPKKLQTKAHTGGRSLVGQSLPFESVCCEGKRRTKDTSKNCRLCTVAVGKRGNLQAEAEAWQLHPRVERTWPLGAAGL